MSDSLFLMALLSRSFRISGNLGWRFPRAREISSTRPSRPIFRAFLLSLAYCWMMRSMTGSSFSRSARGSFSMRSLKDCGSERALGLRRMASRKDSRAVAGRGDRSLFEKSSLSSQIWTKDL